MSAARLASVLAVGLAMAGMPDRSSAQPATLVVTSPTLQTGVAMPRDYTPDGRNVSPPLVWSGAPPGTRSFAVICEDPGAGNPPPFVHWLIYNIPATTAGVPAGIPIDPAAPMPEGLAGAVQGMSGFRRAMYRGPAPPGGPPHEYHFMVYALDVVLPLPAGADRAAFLEAIDGHVLGRGEIVPVYGRPATPASPGGRGRGRGGEE